jgi:hypothetical protein
MLLQLLSVIASTNAIISQHDSNLLTVCCYNEDPAKFTPIYGLTMISSLCGIDRYYRVENSNNFHLNCTNVDPKLVPYFITYVYKVDEIDPDSRDHKFNCQLIKYNGDLSYLFDKKAVTLSVTMEDQDVYTCNLAPNRGKTIFLSNIGSLELNPARIILEFIISVPGNATWIINGIRIQCFTNPCIQKINYDDIATSKIEITRDFKTLIISLM